MTIIPKWLRAKIYRKLYEELTKRQYLVSKNIVNDKPMFLCSLVKKKFPYLPINYYPELWNRKYTCPHLSLSLTFYPSNYGLKYSNSDIKSVAWFEDNFERIKYLREAIELTKKKIK